MAVGAVLAVAGKCCTTCEQEKPLDAFQVKEREPDGAPRRRDSVCRACRNERVRARIGTAPMIPVEPLRKWLGERLEAEGVWDTKLWKAVPDHRAPRSINQIARDWGTSARRLQEILKSRTTLISEINADRLLTGAGSPHLLYVLYSD